MAIGHFLCYVDFDASKAYIRYCALEKDDRAHLYMVHVCIITRYPIGQITPKSLHVCIS